MVKRLRRKFIIIAMCSVFAVLAIIMSVINIVNYVRVVDNADDIVSILKSGGGKFDVSGGEHGGNDGIDDSNRPMLPDRPMSPETPFETRYFTVELNNDGYVVAVNIEHIAAIDEAAAKRYAENLYKKKSASGFYGNYRYGVTSTDFGGKLYIFVDCTRELSGFYNFLWVSFGVSAGGFAVVFLLVYLLSGKMIKPIAESYSKQKRFITDASHEIKTPLTIIGASVDVLDMQNGGNELTEEIKTQVKRLSSLTDKLVFLARMDEQTQRMDMIEFCLSDAVSETVKSFESVAISRGYELVEYIQPELHYRGDETMLRQVVSLLIDNALKYSSQNSKIEVKLNSTNGKIQLTVSNCADDVPNGDLDVLFERFYRKDRSRNSETGGHGIGLSVVKSIVTAHKGKITARKENEVVTFTVTL
ncbi:MAG: HAMP domain-containing histidine kinase [Clostridiales bacterium]|nr:HAMP domain-containing histidine kinase [Clostridiales bacterium]